MSRYSLLIIVGLMLVSILPAQYIVGFEGAGETKTAYTSGTVTLSGIQWNMTEALIGTEAPEMITGARSARLRGYGASVMTMLANKSNGIGSISFNYRRYSSDPQIEWKVEYSTDNGSTWIQTGPNFTATAEVQVFQSQVNLSGTLRIRIKAVVETGTSNKRMNLDDIVLTDYVPVEPSIILNPNTLSGFVYEQDTGPSTAQSYTITAQNLSPESGNLTISGAPSFEYSLSGVNYSSSLQIPYSGSQLSTSVWARMVSGLSAGSYSENASHSGGGATSQLGLSGQVTASTSGFTGSHTQDFSSFVSLETLPFGWVLSDNYIYGGDFGTGSTGGLRGNGVFGIQLTSSAPNNNLTATLSLVNQTGTTINSLNISYMGRVARTDQTGTPKWIVSLNGTVIPELEYDTASGINELRSTTVTGLNIAPGATITLAWFTTSTGTVGTRRQIGIDDLDINTTVIVNPQIFVSGSLSPFSTTQGNPSAAQSYQLGGAQLSSSILISAPSGFELSTDDNIYSPSLSLSPSYNGNVWVRMTGSNSGTFGGNILHSSPGAVDQYLTAVGTVSGTVSYATELFISEYVEGSSYNKAIEIFNGTGTTKDLSDYKLNLFSNGSTSFSSYDLSGQLPHGQVFVVAHPSAVPAILNIANATNSTICNYNGDDAIALYRNSTFSHVDIFGVIGNDPGTAWIAAGGYSTVDKTLVRKATVNSGVTVNPSGTGEFAFTTLATDWDLYPIDYIGNLGAHIFNAGAQEVDPPTIQTSNLIAYPANQQITLEWTPGNGSRRVVKINTVNSFTVPADGTDPTANPVYGGSGEQVVFNGGTQIIEDAPFNGCLVTGLNPATTYWFRIYEYNGVGTYTRYLASTGTNNPLSASTTNASQTGYYAGITGFGSSLKTNLHTLLRTTHTTRYSYTALWEQLPYTDQDPNNPNNVIQIYTGWSVPHDFTGNEPTQWNREHTWSKSHGDFGDVAPAGTDLHHLRPCDATVNSAKGNKDFDNGGTPYVDSSPYPGYSATTGCYTSTYAWEPRDEDKGDVARMMMYMAVRYEGTDTSYNLELVDYTNTAPNNSEPFYGKLSTLLNWHVQDPPDARERQRNDRIFERQGNRNPFIDNPLYAHSIWAPVPTNPSGVTQTGFTANWSTPISATRYFLQVATDSLFINFVTGYSNYDAGLNTSRAITGLSNTNVYYYRLRSYFQSGYSMYSPWVAVNLYVPSGTASLTALGSVYEYDLNGMPVQINLNGVSFADASLAAGSFSLQNVPQGLGIQSVQYLSPSSAILVLSFDGTDFDDNFPMTVTIAAVELSQTSPVTTSPLQLIAYVESLVSIDVQAGNLVLNITPVNGAASYRIFGASDPYGSYANMSSLGSFDPVITTRWTYQAPHPVRYFFKAVGIRN